MKRVNESTSRQVSVTNQFASGIGALVRREWFGFSVVFALLGVAAAVSGNPVATTLIVYICLNSILALSLTLTLGYAGQVNIGQAGFYAIGAYVSAIMTRDYHLPFLLAFAAGGLLAGFMGYFVGFPSLKLKGFYLALATLAFGIIVHHCAGEFSHITGGWTGLSGIPYAEIAGYQLLPKVSFIYFVLAVTFAIFISAQNLVNSRVGRGMRALNISVMGATTAGINVTRYKTQLFALTSVYCGLAGSMLAHYLLYISPAHFGAEVAIMAFAAAAIGGLSSIWGAIIGAAVLTLLPHWLGVYLKWQPLIYGGLVILILLFTPGGLFPSLVKSIRYRQSPFTMPRIFQIALLRARRGAEMKFPGHTQNLHDGGNSNCAGCGKATEND